MAGDVLRLTRINLRTHSKPVYVALGRSAEFHARVTDTTDKLRALGRPKPNNVKFFSSIELITLLADREWLDDATKTIGLHWRRKNAQRHGLTIEKADAPVAVS